MYEVNESNGSKVRMSEGKSDVLSRECPMRLSRESPMWVSRDVRCIGS